MRKNMHNPREIKDIDDFKETLSIRLNAILDYLDTTNPTSEELHEDTVEELYSILYYSSEELK